jgi:hypothetical protein
MIYRNNATIYLPNGDEQGTYQAKTFPSINAAKREVRAKGLTVRRGKPPVRSTAADNSASDANAKS